MVNPYRKITQTPTLNKVVLYSTLFNPKNNSETNENPIPTRIH